MHDVQSRAAPPRRRSRIQKSVTPNNTKKQVYTELFQSIAERLAGQLTVIRTLFESGKKEHSGSALMINGGDDLLYCLTAEHVLTPSKRVPPSTVKVQHNYHVEHMSIGGPSGQKLVPLRRKYFQIVGCDVVLAESAFSGTALVLNSGLAAPVSTFEHTPSIQSLQQDDLLLIAGFPSVQVTELPFVKEAKYNLHGYFFKAKCITSNDPDEHHFRITGNPIGFEPHGLSGSAVWLIRKLGDSEQAGCVFDPLMGDKSEFRLIFIGVVVRYLPKQESFVAVCGGTCAQFVKKGLELMPNIRDGDEHQRIMEIVRDRTDTSSS